MDALWVMGYPQCMIEGARPMEKGMKCAGNAVTVRFVPHRPDIMADKGGGVLVLAPPSFQSTASSSAFLPTMHLFTSDSSPKSILLSPSGSRSIHSSCLCLVY